MSISTFIIIFFIDHVFADKLVWSDEFNGPKGQKPDQSKWNYDTGGDGWGNKELQFYTNSASNAALDGNGNLIISARRENPTNNNCWYGSCQYTSARIQTAGKFTQSYGTFEARIKIPSGIGLWSAFWMIGSNIMQDPWPACGEIDIMENVGQEPNLNHGSLHGPGYSAGNSVTSTYTNNQPLSNDFHVYRADWTANSIVFSVDGKAYATKTPADTKGNRWVFDHPFFLILNIAVGGTWPGSPNQSTIFPQQMTVDYVRVYTKDNNNNSNNNIDNNTPGKVVQIKGIGGRCLDVRGAQTANGTPIQLYDCNGSAAQKFTLGNDGTIRAYGKCIDVQSAAKNDGATVQLYDCNGTGAQKWNLPAAGDIVNVNADKCLHVKEPANQNSAITVISTCEGIPNQKWTTSA